MKERDTYKNFAISRDPSKKNALVLAGGGAKGCYHVGVLQYLAEAGMTFQGVTGTSIGAMVGAFYVQDDIHKVTDFVMGMTPDAIAEGMPAVPATVKEMISESKNIMTFMLNNMYGRLDVTPLRKSVDDIFDFDSFQNSDIAYGCMTYNDTRKEPRGFLKKDFTRENASEIIMASAACYPAFPKVELDGELYMDGMYADNVPIKLMEEVFPDWDQMVVVDIGDPNEHAPKDLTDRMFCIQPLLHPGNSADFTSEHAIRLYNQGYLEAAKYFGTNPGYIYTFTRDDADLIDVVENYLQQQMEQHKVVLPFNTSVDQSSLQYLLGYQPKTLNNVYSRHYRYGKLVEALGLMAKVEPVKMRDYTSFLRETCQKLNEMSLSNTDEVDYKMIEMLDNLKKEELTVRYHKMLVSGGGVYPAAVEAVKESTPNAYVLAYIWYFIEELIRNLPDQG